MILDTPELRQGAILIVALLCFIILIQRGGAVESKKCECASWCRPYPQEKGEHHMLCEHYDDTVKVVRITHNGSTLIDTDVAETLSSMADWDDGEYKVEITSMLKREVDALDEFKGF